MGLMDRLQAKLRPSNNEGVGSVGPAPQARGPAAPPRSARAHSPASSGSLGSMASRVSTDSGPPRGGAQPSALAAARSQAQTAAAGLVNAGHAGMLPGGGVQINPSAPGGILSAAQPFIDLGFTRVQGQPGKLMPPAAARRSASPPSSPASSPASSQGSIRMPSDLSMSSLSSAGSASSAASTSAAPSENKAPAGHNIDPARIKKLIVGNEDKLIGLLPRKEQGDIKALKLGISGMRAQLLGAFKEMKEAKPGSPELTQAKNKMENLTTLITADVGALKNMKAKLLPKVAVKVLVKIDQSKAAAKMDAMTAHVNSAGAIANQSISAAAA
jgi:hypothetical protein